MKGDREAEGVNKPPAAQASLASLHFPLLLYPPSLPLKHTADEQGLEIALGEAMKTRIVTLKKIRPVSTGRTAGRSGPATAPLFFLYIMTVPLSPSTRLS